MQGFQLWVNLPAADKMNAPAYQEYAPEQTPEYILENGAVVKAIAGRATIGQMKLEGVVSNIATSPLYLDIKLPPDTSMDIGLAKELTVLTYVFEGALSLSDTELEQVAKGQLAKWGSGDRVLISSSASGSRLLLLAARPIGEPVVHYGPFVMNTAEEIEQALADYKNGQLVANQ